MEFSTSGNKERTKLPRIADNTNTAADKDSTTTVVPVGRGYTQKNWIGVCGPPPKTLSLFIAKICDFPYPIYDLTKNLIPYL